VTKVYNAYPDRPESNNVHKRQIVIYSLESLYNKGFPGKKIFSAHFEHKFIDKGLSGGPDGHDARSKAHPGLAFHYRDF